ncbi:hypothetical protein EN851_07585 [Mesorhizobium sp. M8A.F.Ca.ET.208.01.1.1]|uniref:hypothetical protein n=1 Tax=unclassified Mesorhizobium TaxID=325217 RepID=UPI0010940C20|nr:MULTISPECIES: hypothetical protein [unclassified Mesorhizobium]TGQ95375.1 hypothetical protein EN851_07585 [Mesorhizobium sp. M8A.F.Ca.ET.208.01.1.1]TGT55866.1 hypothetical protein EN810_07585 [Mesorhizobium sp. M8A.F.Ca.ET.167.01.1.1]
MTPKEFRAELTKLMPGYSWTVHKSRSDALLKATGIKSSGFNRLSTLLVERRDNYAATGRPWYEVKSAGFGLRAPFLADCSDGTLARALRGLQTHYETMASTYLGHAMALQSARPQKEPATVG